MPRPTTDLKGVAHIANSTLMQELESNLKMWLDWGLLRIGAWFDVVTPSTPSGYGGNFAKLRPVEDPNFTDGQVWESARKDWVWETSVDYIDLNNDTKNPIEVDSTVLVNGTPTSYSWIDYPMGRVYFNTPLDTDDVVLASYSYRWAQIYQSSQAEWWKELQYRSFRVDDSFFTSTPGGGWTVGGQHRVQMPCVVIESIPKVSSKPYQLGDGSAWVKQDVACHVLAENPADRNKIVDILRGQFDCSIYLFNSNEISSAGAWPLDYRGMIVDSAQTYPALVDADTGYRWVNCRFTKTDAVSMQSFHSRLYEAQVNLTCEVVLPD